MKTRTASQTAIICAAGVLVVALVAIPLELHPGNDGANPARGVVLLALAGVLGLAVTLAFRYATTGRRAQVELADSERYRQLAEEYRRLADIAITAQEHTDLKHSDLSPQLGHLRAQSDSLHKILKEVE
jgi:hypothetical protein